MTQPLIPFLDLRGKTSIELLRTYPDRGRALIHAARSAWGIGSRLASIPALPVADFLSHRWLKKRWNPYLYEIETCAEMLAVPGGHALNLAFEWGCTGGVWNSGGSVSLLRVLDWPFPAMGKNAAVAFYRGRAGEYYSVTWPGLAGVFTALAPGRFSLAVNQAPMRRHGLGFAGDWAANRLMMRKAQGLPPSHLARRVCETAKTYEQAKKMLAESPIALPAIFILGGVRPGEGAIIERLETCAETLELGKNEQVAAANHFVSPLGGVGKGWRPREIDSAGRLRQAGTIAPHELEAAHFGWLKSPIINPHTRLAVVADAATGRLMAQGFEGMLPVTGLFHLPGKNQYEQAA